ncbi:TPA: hypothetical protein HA246_01730, partial [Candidatus Woesearchaeota archaeon]|nr:hypothetical protein [Candidatus Woesearchaeota archaeon]
MKTNSKILLVLSVLILVIFLVSCVPEKNTKGNAISILSGSKSAAAEAASKYCSISDSITEGETKTYNDGKYKIENIIVTDSGDIYSQFKVNEKLTSKLNVGSGYILADGASISVVQITPDPENILGDVVMFCIDAPETTTTTQEVPCSGDVVDSITEGLTKTYTVGSKDFKILNVVVTDSAPIYTQFKINSKLTKNLKVGEGDVLEDGSKVTVSQITNKPAGDVLGDSVKFCLSGITSAVSSKEIPCSGDVVDSLDEGATKSYTIGSNSFKVVSALVSDTYISFSVNGKLTDKLAVGGSYSLADGSKITVSQVITQPAGSGIGDSVKFCLSGIKSAVSSKEIPCTGDVVDSLDEGATKSYTIGSNSFKVVSALVSDTYISFSVNGKLTDKLAVGGSY